MSGNAAVPVVSSSDGSAIIAEDSSGVEIMANTIVIDPEEEEVDDFSDIFGPSDTTAARALRAARLPVPESVVEDEDMADAGRLLR